MSIRSSGSKDTLELDTLLRQGEAAARVGDRAEAETLLRRAVDEYPYSEDALLHLAGVVENMEEKRALLLRVQEMNPASEEARLGLERINVKLGPMPITTPDAVEAVQCVCGSSQMTVLRCSKCGKPICPKCSVRTPVGLRCRECAAVRKSPVYTLSVRDYLIAGAVGLALATVAGVVMRFFGGFGFFAIFIGLFVGGGVADLMSRAIRYKRGVGMQVLAGVCLLLGAMLGVLLSTGALLPLLTSGNLRAWTLLVSAINPFYIFAAIAAAVGRLR